MARRREVQHRRTIDEVMAAQASGRRSRAARRLSHGSRASFVALALALAGCGPAPSTSVPAAGAAPAPPPNLARFDLRTDERVTGTVSVKSSGPYLADVDGRQRTVIAITIDVDNTDGARELVVDPADLRLAFADATTPRLDDVAPAGSSGRATIAPKRSATLRAHFTLPADVSPEQVQRYDLTWALRDGDRVAYQLKTPFVAAATGVAYVPSARCRAHRLLRAVRLLVRRRLVRRARAPVRSPRRRRDRSACIDPCRPSRLGTFLRRSSRRRSPRGHAPWRRTSRRRRSPRMVTWTAMFLENDALVDTSVLHTGHRR